MKSPSSPGPIPAHFITVRSALLLPHVRGIRSGLLLPLLLLFGPAAPAADQFVLLPSPATTSSGSWGLALGDYDRDGDLDIAVATGTSSSRRPIDLYRNRGDGTFDRMMESQVGDIVTERRLWYLVQWTDVDNDGWLDLLASNSFDSVPAHRVFRNRGDGTFRAAPAGDWGDVQGPMGPMPACDLNGDGWSDLISIVQEGDRFFHEFHFNRGDGTFEGRVDEPNLSDNFIANLDSWADFDNDGDLDIFVSNQASGGTSRLYLNDGRGYFTIVTKGPLLQGGSNWAAWGDYDQDGDFDCIVSQDVSRLFRNDGGTFAEAAISPLARSGLYSWFDFDNDARLDLLISGLDGITYTNTLLRGVGNGAFEEASEPFTGTGTKQAYSAWGDIDNDGALDLVQTRGPSGGIRIYRNLSNANHWLKLRLQGTASSTDALGALVRIRAVVGGKSVHQVQHVGGGHPIANDLRPNFGLGDATVAEEVRIEWPSGSLTVLTNVTANQILDVTEVVNFEPARPVAVINGTVSLTHTLPASSRQWYSDAGALAGQTGQVLTLAGLQPSQSGRYLVVAQTATGSQTNHVYLRVLSPALNATRVAEGVRIECRGDPATRYRLQSSALVTGSWADEPTLTTDAAGVATATVPIEAGSRFFRLVKE